MRSFVNTIAHIFGFEKDPNSPSNSEDDDDWGDDNPRITMIKEQLEYYFSGINLEKDKNFRNEIEESEDGSVPVDYFLKCNRMKYLNATREEILDAGHSSEYLDADSEEETIRSKEPFHPDPERYKRIIVVSGLGKKVPQYAQIQFFNSIFPGEIVYVYLQRNESNGELEYSNKSLVEFTTAKRVEEILEKGIVYGKGNNELLDVKPYFMPKNRNNNNKRKHHHEQQEEEQSETESEQESTAEEEEQSENESDHNQDEEERNPSDSAEYIPQAEEEEKTEENLEAVKEEEERAEDNVETVKAEEENAEDNVEPVKEEEEKAEDNVEPAKEEEEKAEDNVEPAKEEEEKAEVPKEEEEEKAEDEKSTPRRKTPKKRGARGRAARPAARE